MFPDSLGRSLLWIWGMGFSCEGIEKVVCKSESRGQNVKSAQRGGYTHISGMHRMPINIAIPVFSSNP